MKTLWDALDAFLQEHRRCGALDGGVEGERVWMTCECGARISHALDAYPLEVFRPSDKPPSVARG
jgi:hypothetical protein